MKKILTDEMIEIRTRGYCDGDVYLFKTGAKYAGDIYESEIEKRDERIAHLEYKYKKLDDLCMKMNAALSGDK